MIVLQNHSSRHPSLFLGQETRKEPPRNHR